MDEMERPYSKLQWFFYMIFVPALFGLILAAMLFTFLGYNVIDQVKGLAEKLPGRSEPTSEQASGVGQQVDPDQQLVLAQNELDQLLQENEHLHRELEQFKTLAQELEKQLGEQEEAQVQEKISAEEREQQIRELGRMYGSMSASRAANILSEMSISEAALILSVMRQQERTAILGRLDPSLAAQITVMLKETSLVEDLDRAALQERVQILTRALDEQDREEGKTSIYQLAKTFGSLPANRAAEMLENMANTQADFQLGVQILTLMSNDQRSAILGAMNVQAAQRYTRALAG